MIIDFDKWLQEYHAEYHPEILDDELPDAFNDWLCELEPDDLIVLGQKFAEQLIKKVQIFLGD